MLDREQVFAYFTNAIFHFFVNQDLIIILNISSKSPTNLGFRNYFYKWCFTFIPWIFFHPVKFFMKPVVQNFKFSTLTNKHGYSSYDYCRISVIYCCVHNYGYSVIFFQIIILQGIVVCSKVELSFIKNMRPESHVADRCCMSRFYKLH